MLKIVVKERDKDFIIFKQEPLMDYKGEIVFKLISKNNSYQYLYSLDGGQNYTLFAETSDTIVICRGYIGTNLGIYSTSDGNPTKEYADFDWINYKGSPKF